MLTHQRKYKPLSGQSTLCISLSEKPGRLGTVIHNAGYQALELDYLYKAFSTQDIAGALTGVKALEIRGCSISMPFKESVMKYLDSIDKPAFEIGAVNTIVNENGHLKGFNTDLIGVLASLQPYLTDQSEKVMILGGGGVARAILHALTLLGQQDIMLSVRQPKQYQHVADQFGVNLIDWSSRHHVETTILINATPIGMSPHDAAPIELEQLDALRLVMDVVVASTPTALVKRAKARCLNVIDGLTMALYQAYEQFYLYTGVLAPREVMCQAAMNFFQSHS